MFSPDTKIFCPCIKKQCPNDDTRTHTDSQDLTDTMVPILPCKVSTTLNWTVSLKNSFSIPYFSFCYKKSKINNKIKLCLKEKRTKTKIKKKRGKKCLHSILTHLGRVLLHSGSALLINIEKGWSLFSSKITDSPFFFAGPHTHPSSLPWARSAGPWLGLPWSPEGLRGSLWDADAPGREEGGGGVGSAGVGWEESPVAAWRLPSLLH